MFDAAGAFTRQFKPMDGGYVYYPSRKAGGKLVTVDEYETMVANWQRIAGTRGRWKTVGLVSLAILLWTLASEAFALPEWSNWIISVATVAGLSGWLLWASLAPRRLVSERTDFVPPRPAPAARREARAALNWPFVLIVLLVSGAAFVGTMSSSDRSLSWLALLIGSGAFFAAYLWIAFQKLWDRQG